MKGTEADIDAPERLRTLDGIRRAWPTRLIPIQLEEKTRDSRAATSPAALTGVAEWDST